MQRDSFCPEHQRGKWIRFVNKVFFFLINDSRTSVKMPYCPKICSFQNKFDPFIVVEIDIKVIVCIKCSFSHNDHTQLCVFFCIDLMFTMFRSISFNHIS